ncbi:hypothetical protein MTHERMMSTA1_25600 [Methanosarcina thermophila MST-A1]|jgi:hypothetical protein|nr:hypothetical protein MTHERMMSTA1_25600 [Methanosarcina thermophila MST-A1]
MVKPESSLIRNSYKRNYKCSEESNSNKILSNCVKVALKLYSLKYGHVQIEKSVYTDS